MLDPAQGVDVAPGIGRGSGDEVHDRAPHRQRRAGAQHVVAHGVEAGAAVQGVGTRAACQELLRVGAGDPVRAGAAGYGLDAEETVGAAAGLQHIAAFGEPSEHGRGQRNGDGAGPGVAVLVHAGAAVEVLVAAGDRQEQVVEGRAQHRVMRARGDGDAAHPHQRVGAAPAIAGRAGVEVHDDVAGRGAAIGRLHGMAAIAQNAVIAAPAFQRQGEEAGGARGAAVERVVAGGAGHGVDAGEAVGRAARLGRGAGAMAGEAHGYRPCREVGIAQRVGAARAALDPVRTGAPDEHLAEAAADQGVVPGGAGARGATLVDEEGPGNEVRNVERHAARRRSRCARRGPPRPARRRHPHRAPASRPPARRPRSPVSRTPPLRPGRGSAASGERGPARSTPARRARRRRRAAVARCHPAR